MNIVLIALGGALGSLTRYFTFAAFASFLNRSSYANFPWPTLFVNIVGSMLAGITYYFMIKYFDSLDDKLKNFILIGFLGGFTTFSAFSLDFFRLFNAGQIMMALVYALSSVILAILALFFGFYLMKIFI